MKAALLYYRGSGFSAAFIRWFTKSKFAHVAPAIYDDAGHLTTYDAFWATGIIKNGARGPDGFQRLPFDDTAILVKQAWLEQQVGKPYDKLAIFAIGLSKRLPGGFHVGDTRQGRWICSRLAAVFAGIEADCWGLSGPPSPEDVHRIVSEKHV